MAAYYNEIDLFAADWLRNLINAGLIADGEVDTRSIALVEASDLKRFTQCHFFAGIAGWSHALRLAGWPDDSPIWTGSCPCQPFSVAGKGKGKEDERHLWPHFFRLIRSCRPAVVMGEQVAGKAGYDWFDGVRSDLEGEDYASRAVDIPACAVNAPHIRQRLYWCAVGDADAMRQLQPKGIVGQQRGWAGDTSGGDMVNADSAGHREHGGAVAIQTQQPSAQCAGGDAYDMADAKSDRHQEWEWQDRQQNARSQRQGGMDIAGNNQSFWHNAEWLTGADGKTRRAKPGVRLLVDGVPNRVGRLRGYGNAIVPQVAEQVIRALMDTEL
jgi:DNA (cytosine-5)-methyltransferase 1